MPALVLNITNNSDHDRLVDGAAANFGYADEIPDPDNEGQTIPNPQSKKEFLQSKLANVLKDWAVTGEVSPDQDALTKKRNQVSREIKGIDVR